MLITHRLALSTFVCTGFLAAATTATAGQATLQWNASPDPTVTGYVISLGLASGVYGQQVDVGNATSYTFPALNDFQTYYFAVQAYNAAGLRSAYSAEVVRPATTASAAPAVQPAQPAPIGDFGTDGSPNSTGTPDILWQHANGYLSVWFMNQFAQMTSAAYLTPNTVSDPAWRIVGTGDFDQDGKIDIVWQHKIDGWIAVWLMDGTVLKNAVLVTPSQVSDTRWSIMAVGDMDGDGKPDLIWQHTNGTVAAWLMNGTQLRSSVLLSPSSVLAGTWRIVGAADFDSDGKTDLLWQRMDGWLAVWFMDGTVMRSSPLLNPQRVSSPDWHIVAVADYNQDGHPDILWQHTNGWLAVWHMNGLTMIDSPLLSPPQVAGGTTWQIVGPH